LHIFFDRLNLCIPENDKDHLLVWGEIHLSADEGKTPGAAGCIQIAGLKGLKA
jgi:hypothetical protein